ncbi:28S ribosomal protein S15, mitochondrial [Haemaphysalis longicornis]
MSSFVRLSGSVSALRSLFSKLSVSEGTTWAAVHTAAAADRSQPDSVLCRRACPGPPVHVSRRFRNRKILSWPTDYLPYEWSYPAPLDIIAKSGDLVQDTGPTDPAMPLSGFELSDELKTASPEVKRVFSLQLGSPRQVHEAKKYEFLKRCQRHPYDFNSFEYKVAHKTFLVRKYKELFHQFPRRKDLKDALCQKIQKRNRLLKYLHRYDRERFHFVSRALQVTYVPAPMHRVTLPVSKKGDLRRLTREYCDKLKEEKMQAFHQKLRAERAAFLEEKHRALEWIRTQEERFALSEEERRSTECEGVLDKIKHTE